jgi:hypothetical protein
MRKRERVLQEIEGRGKEWQEWSYEKEKKYR